MLYGTYSIAIGGVLCIEGTSRTITLSSTLVFCNHQYRSWIITQVPEMSGITSGQPIGTQGLFFPSRIFFRKCDPWYIIFAIRKSGIVSFFILFLSSIMDAKAKTHLCLPSRSPSNFLHLSRWPNGISVGIILGLLYIVKVDFALI